jgi:integrase
MVQPKPEEPTMPRAYEMTWDDRQSRWVKMYKGQRYTVACSVLNAPDTKEGSRVQANQWWKARRAEIDSANKPRPPLPLEDLYRAWVSWSCRDVPPEVRALYEKEFAQSPESAIRRVAEGLVGALMSGQPMPPEIAGQLPSARLHQVETAVAMFRGQTTAEPEKTVGEHVELWLKALQQQAEAGQISPGRVANCRGSLAHFLAFVGPQADVATVNGELLEGFYGYCLKKMTGNGQKAEWSAASARNVFSDTKCFINWLAGRGTIDPPRNLASRQFKFGSPAKAIETWTPDEFRAAVDAASGKLKLALLLMANTGATQADVSELRDDEVDWEAGRIIRKRTKTRDQANVPVVNYLLWPSTFALLKQHRSGQDRVLLTDSGKPYVRVTLKENGTRCKADGFAACFDDLKKKKLPGFNRPLKELRKTSASLLETKPEYRGFSTLFLGHSPRSIADRHYVRPPQDLFDQAVLWLGRQLDQVEPEPEPVKKAKASRGRG